ncbi:MAG: HAD-IC family P-type ATPase, partial [Aureliella sp.]
IVAAGVSFILGEMTDTVVILAIVVLNAALGFAQDYRAEKSLAALKRLTVPQVRVRRDGKVRERSARELVPGDIVLLEVGNFVPADGRLIEVVNLTIQEAALTGESEPVRKQTAALDGAEVDGIKIDAAELPLGDRTNMAYMGTVVTYGHGQVLVTATGMQSELGDIASSLQSVAAQATPLQKRLAQLGTSLALVALAIVALVFGLGWLRGEEPRLLMMTALSLAVAVVPEGLPAVATVALALGARRLFHRHALIRKLPAVETLGSVTVICSDKTGTLTENRMTVTVLDVAGGRLDLPAGAQAGVALDWDAQSTPTQWTLPLLLAGAGLCNDAMLDCDEGDQAYRAVGDPTETALALVAARLGYPQQQLLKYFPRISELPFDSERKRMTTVQRVQFDEVSEATSPSIVKLVKLVSNFNTPYIAFTKGAVDSLLETCQFVWEDSQPQPLTEELRTRIASANARLASNGMRVLGVAMRLLSDVEYHRMTAADVNDHPASKPNSRPASNQAESYSEIEQDEIFVGMLGMLDPPRQEAVEAVDRCRKAGIRPVMITGDHPLTAQHIAGILGFNNHRVVTGAELEKLSSVDLAETVKSASVYARVSPKHKLQLVQALQADGQVVAMTGDGVNDAPALKQAHIGVAMGITGTDVSKEASQMVLLDDNFATIVGAVEQGRVVYDNIRKFVKYTMTSNAGEVWVMVLGPLLGMPLPLLPLQILWINLVTDGLPGLALAVEKAERDTMEREPYPPEQHIFGAGMGRD